MRKFIFELKGAPVYSSYRKMIATMRATVRAGNQTWAQIAAAVGRPKGWINQCMHLRQGMAKEVADRLAAVVGCDQSLVDQAYKGLPYRSHSSTAPMALVLPSVAPAATKEDSHGAVAIEDVKGLIMNPYKHLVRNGIINQARTVCEHRRRSKRVPYKCVTLPGTNFVFEQTLSETLAYEGIPATFDCFEMHPQRFKFACNEGVPFNVNFKFADFMDNSIRSGRPRYNLIWTDFCCTAGEEIIRRLVASAVSWELDPDTLLYATFCLSRKKSQRLSAELGFAGKTLPEAIAAAFMLMFERGGLPAKQIYCLAYPGGKSAKTPMVTVGFQLRPTIDVPVITGEKRFNLENKGLRRINPTPRKRRCDAGKKKAGCPAHVKKTDRAALDAFLMQYYDRYGAGYTDLNNAKCDKEFRGGFIHAAMKKFDITHHQPTGLVVPTRTK